MYVYPQFQAPVQQIYSPQPLENMHCIIESEDGKGGLFLGDLLATMKPDILAQHNIGAILSVAFDAKYNKTQDPRTQHIVNKHVLAYDMVNYDISQHFQECYQWIDQHLNQGIGVLVHCKAGVSRSASIVIAYLMKKYNMTLQKAYTHVKSRRQRIQPNQGFRNLLMHYQLKVVTPGNTNQMTPKKPKASTEQILKNSTGVSEDTNDDKPFSPASTSNDLNINGFGGYSNQKFGSAKQNIQYPFTDRTKTPKKNSLSQMEMNSLLNTPKSGSLTQRSIQQQQFSPQSILRNPFYGSNLMPNQNWVGNHNLGLGHQTGYQTYQYQPQQYPYQQFIQYQGVNVPGLNTGVIGAQMTPRKQWI